MAYVPANMAKIGTSGLGSLFVYKDDDATAGQLKATIIAANFFADKRIMGQIQVGDTIIVHAKDASTLVKVSAKDMSAFTIAVTQFSLA